MYARFKTRKWRAMTEADRIDDYLQRLTPLARSCLLTELERLEVSGDEIPGSAALLDKLRAEFRKNEQIHKGEHDPERVANPSRYFFNPLEPLLVNGAPEHANSGWILRGSLAPIWEWISRDLLPTMARDYVDEMKPLIAADKQQEARRVAATFQTKVVKYLESTLGSPNGVNQTRIKLATYTASRAVCRDLASMVCVLRVRDGLAKFSDALPATIEKFDDAKVSRITALLDAFGKNHAEALPFAVALVAKRLKAPWELVHLATKAASSKNAADIAATPYAITVSMVLDRIDDRRSALRVALKINRVIAAKHILTAIDDIEHALRVRIDLLDGSAWGDRLNELMTSIAAMAQAGFPASVNHVLGSRSPRSHQTMAGRLTRLISKGRDAMSHGAAFCMKLAGRN
jgi:hypothetical protein